MPLPAAKVKQLCRESLPQVGIEPDQAQNGIDFYKYFFTNHPDLRSYFKGAENFTADQVQKSDRFSRLGTGMLLSNHVLADIYDDPLTFKAFIRDLVDRHKDRKLDPKLWKIFYSVFIGYLESKKPLTAEQKEAWTQLGNDFAEECNSQLKRTGLPHL